VEVDRALGDQRFLAAPNLGEDRVDELFLAAEVVEEHARARVQRRREGAQAEALEAVLEDVLRGQCERPPASLRVGRTCQLSSFRVSDTVVS
jgi:hypothetical protein